MGQRLSRKQVPFEKSVISRPDKRFSAFCGSKMFIIVPTKVTIFPMLSQLNSVKSYPTHSFNIHFNIIHSSTSVPYKVSFLVKIKSSLYQFSSCRSISIYPIRLCVRVGYTRTTDIVRVCFDSVVCVCGCVCVCVCVGLCVCLCVGVGE